MFSRLILCIALATLATGCCSHTSDAPPPGFDQASPKRTVTYLKWAYEKEKPFHVANCLSEGFFEGTESSPSDVATFWSSAKELIDEQIGDVNNVELDEEIAEDPNGKWRIYRAVSPDRVAIVTFVVESKYKIVPKKITRPNAEGSFDSMEAIVDYEGDTAVIRLPKVPNADDYSPDSIHRITIESSWRIDALETEVTDENGKKSIRRIGNQIPPKNSARANSP